eukprot:gb/GECG01000285.1/.p1 GENE.gb/GECG01000285.1/~~gb/GECG01000285.1/.p1  ORF type:complete len:110 (+),score=3.73 gb/GECG01000285.1/:1-330(+)
MYSLTCFCSHDEDGCGELETLDGKLSMWYEKLCTSIRGSICMMTAPKRTVLSFLQHWHQENVNSSPTARRPLRVSTVVRLYTDIRKLELIRMSNILVLDVGTGKIPIEG